MKKLLLALLAACVLLTGCGAAQPPEKALDGSKWEESWVTVGNTVGVDTPDTLTLRDNNEALASQGMYYATWSIGEPEPYTNKEGNEVSIYDAQINLLLAGFREDGGAEKSAAEWLEMAQEQYHVSETRTETFNGQEYTLLACTYDSETNPYTGGAAAFGVYDSQCAAAVEVSCRDTYAGDPMDLLTDFLSRCHIADWSVEN